ncbi:MAG: hypothetical protein ACOCOE_07615, partial [Prevotella sp.]
VFHEVYQRADAYGVLAVVVGNENQWSLVHKKSFKTLSLMSATRRSIALQKYKKRFNYLLSRIKYVTLQLRL